MSDPLQPRAAILGLFGKRIEGDDCLLELARQRFRRAGLGAEMHAATSEELEWLLRFRPSEETPVFVHLARDCTLAEGHNRERIAALAARFAGRAQGLVAQRPDDGGDEREEGE